MTELDDLREQLADYLSGWLPSYLDKPDSELDEMAKACADSLTDDVVAPVLEGLRAELDRQRESRIAWALEADRLDQEQTHLIKAVLGLTEQRAALSSLLRGMARRVGQKRKEIRLNEMFGDREHAKRGVDLEAAQHAAASWERAAHGNQEYATVLYAELLQARAEIDQLRARPSVSDQTPATPDVGRCGEPAPRLSKYEGPRVWCALPAGHAGWHKADDSREWSRTDAAPSSVQGGTTPPHEVDLLRQAAKAAREHGNELSADMFEMAAKDHEDDDCPKGERAECMAVELARKALAEYATSAPSECDTTPEEA